MISETYSKEFYVLRYVKSAPDAGGSTRALWVRSAPLKGVLTNVNSTDVETFTSNILSRQKRLRAFLELDVSYNDKVEIDGEEWNVVGEPETITSIMNPRQKSTLIILEKEGKG